MYLVNKNELLISFSYYSILASASQCNTARTTVYEKTPLPYMIKK